MPIATTIATLGADRVLSKVISNLPNIFSTMKSDSLIEYTESTRVEPIALVDHTIADLPIMNDLARSITSLYAAYYLQAIAISTNINNVKIMNVLDKLNPARSKLSAFGTLLQPATLSSEPKYGSMLLPGFDHVQTSNITISPSAEALGVDSLFDSKGDISVGGGGTNLKLVDGDKDELLANNQSGVMDKATRDNIADMALNLSTGILMNVTVGVDGHTAVIPVTVRLITSLATPKLLTQMMTHSAKDKSMKARYTGYRTGELSLKELIFATDVIDAHREGLIKDKTGVYKQMTDRKNNNRIAGLLSKNPSVSTASNIMIISSDTLRDIELEVGGSISNTNLRNRIFKSSYLIFLVVVDTKWERITIYHRGIPTPTETDYRAVKSSSKGGNTDIVEYLKQFQLGNSPTF